MIIERNIPRTFQVKAQKQSLPNGDLLTISKKQASSLNQFCYGFIIYTLGFIASYVESVLPPTFLQLVEAIGLIMVIIGAIGLVKVKFDNVYLQVMVILYMIISISVVVRINNFDFDNIKLLLFQMSFSVFAYFTPLIIFFPRNIQVYKKINKTAIVLGFLSLIYAVMYYKILKTPNWVDRDGVGYIETYFFCLVFPIGFVLLTYVYYKQEKVLLALFVMGLSLLFLILRARRSSMFMCMSTMMAAGIVYLIYTKRWVMVISLSVVLAFMGTIVVSNIKLPRMFDLLMARKDDDTRTYVEVAMQADMQPKDWIIGKGITGTYFCPHIDEKNDINGQRNIVETGYLQIILKGGILSLVLLGLIFLPAIYLGLFKSANILSKAAGLYILLWTLYLYPTVITGFSLYYVMIWMCVGICYSKKIRNLPDSTIKKYFKD